jgi:hypothetical protein
MRLSSLLLVSLSLLASSTSFLSVSALTNGTLLPPYMCGPPGDGLPKSVGGVLPFFQLATNPGPANQVMDGVVKIPGRPLDAPQGTVLNTQLLVAGFHSAGVQATVITPVVNPIQVALRQAMPAGQITPLIGAAPNSIIPGKDHALSVQAFPNGAFDVNTALDGGIVWAQNGAGVRVGQFINTGAMMQVWAACGPNNVGVVHNQLLSCTGEYPMAVTDAAGNTNPAPVTDGLIWRAPANLAVGDIITFKGAGVTDLGFGSWTTTFPVAAVPAPTVVPAAPTVTKVIQVQNQAAIFFQVLDLANGDTYTVTLVDVTQANKVVLAVPKIAASPAIISFGAAAKAAGVAKGDTLAWSVTAQNAIGSSPASNVLQTIAAKNAIVVAPGVAGAAAPIAAPKARSNSLELELGEGFHTADSLSALCDSSLWAQEDYFNMEHHDADGSCRYASAVQQHLSNTVAASPFAEPDLIHGEDGQIRSRLAVEGHGATFQAKSFVIGISTAIAVSGLVGAMAYAATNRNSKK